jgi:hypothetical protein
MINVSISRNFIASICLFFIFSCNNRISKKASPSKVIVSKNIYNIINSDTTNYDKYNLDFDNDGLSDAIFSNKFLLGDSLFIFKNNNHKYELTLKTINFSEDGVYVIKNIKKVDYKKCNLLIDTYFNGEGGMKKEIYLDYNINSKKWKIDNSIFKTTYCDENDNCFNKTCNIIQNVILDKNTNWTNYKNIADYDNSECVVEKIKK